jgi:hypothetical protein
VQWSRAHLEGPVPVRNIPAGSSDTDILQFRFVLLID